MDIQQFERLLMRYERLAGLAPRSKWLEKECLHLQRTLSSAQEGNRRRDRDMDAALNKILEWTGYAADLDSRLTKKDQQITRPRRPKPLETESPF